MSQLEMTENMQTYLSIQSLEDLLDAPEPETPEELDYLNALFEEFEGFLDKEYLSIQSLDGIAEMEFEQ